MTEEKAGEKILSGARYECVRCATPVTGDELAKLPEPTCANCGYKVFRKVRGPAAKSLKAE